MTERETRAHRSAERSRSATSRRRGKDEADDHSAREKASPKAREPKRSADAGRKADSDSGIGARRAAAAAATYVQEMTGRRPESLTALERTEEGWRIGVEALESKRIPDSTDILAVYRVDLDKDGELLSYQRERRYHRGRVEGEDQ